MESKIRGHDMEQNQRRGLRVNQKRMGPDCTGSREPLVAFLFFEAGSHRLA